MRKTVLTEGKTTIDPLWKKRLILTEMEVSWLDLKSQMTQVWMQSSHIPVAHKNLILAGLGAISDPLAKG